MISYSTRFCHFVRGTAEENFCCRKGGGLSGVLRFLSFGNEYVQLFCAFQALYISAWRLTCAIMCHAVIVGDLSDARLS